MVDTPKTEQFSQKNTDEDIFCCYKKFVFDYENMDLIFKGGRQEFSENRGFQWPIAGALQIVRPNMTSL